MALRRALIEEEAKKNSRRNLKRGTEAPDPELSAGSENTDTRDILAAEMSIRAIRRIRNHLRMHSPLGIKAIRRIRRIRRGGDVKNKYGPYSRGHSRGIRHDKA